VETPDQPVITFVRDGCSRIAGGLLDGEALISWLGPLDAAESYASVAVFHPSLLPGAASVEVVVDQRGCAESVSLEFPDGPGPSVASLESAFGGAEHLFVIGADDSVLGWTVAAGTASCSLFAYPRADGPGICRRVQFGRD
jgi:hypothetical protein